MLYKILLVSVLLTLFVFSTKKNEKPDWISLEYFGPQNKPSPTIIFYRNTFPKIKSPIYYEYKVDGECLEGIKKTILHFDSAWLIKDGRSIGYYNFTIKCDSTLMRYATDNKSNTGRLLTRILSNLRDTILRKEVQISFDEIVERIW